MICPKCGYNSLDQEDENKILYPPIHLDYHFNYSKPKLTDQALEYFMSLVEKRKAMGENYDLLDFHGRTLEFINFSQATHIIEDVTYSLKSKIMKMRLRLLPTKQGKEIERLLLSGCEIKPMIRAIGNKNEITVLITFDIKVTKKEK
jgi:hypothetical protein